MAKYFPPIDRNYTFLQTNRSDFLGNLWATYGIDFQSNIGAIRVSPKMVISTNSVDDADLGLPSAFENFGGVWWAICGTRIFKTANLTGTDFAEDASASVPTDFGALNSDMAIYNDRLWVTTTDALLRKNSSTGSWTEVTTFSTGFVHKLAVLKKTNRLYVLGANDIYSVNEDNNVVNSAGDYYINLSDSFGATHGTLSTMEASTDSIWIGTIQEKNNFCVVYKWDGISSQISDQYKIDAGGVIAMKIIDDIPYIVDSYGRILKFNGTGFVEVARLPYDSLMFANATESNTTSHKFIHYNGMAVTADNTILINVLPRQTLLNADSFSEHMNSGIWELDLSNGNLTHKHSYSFKKIDDTTITDYSQPILREVGAIKINPFSNSNTAGRTGILGGARYYTNASSSAYGIFILNSISANEKQKIGYVVTNWFTSDEIEDVWNCVKSTFRRFLNSTDKIVFKYRTEEEDPIYANITWVNETSFTTTTNVSAYSPANFDGVFGGEVEILHGTGGGANRHITNVVESGGTYTVTLDNAVTGVTTGTARARFQKWFKLLPEVTGQEVTSSDHPIAKNSPRIQIKIVFEFTGNNEFHKMAIYNTQHKIIQA